jgi:hypothetical protein
LLRLVGRGPVRLLLLSDLQHNQTTRLLKGDGVGILGKPMQVTPGVWFNGTGSNG